MEFGIDSFREFPGKCRELADQLTAGLTASQGAKALAKPVVTYCTGGVRCEKATVAMMDAGFTDVYQLDGGILRYFEECGGSGGGCAEEATTSKDSGSGVSAESIGEAAAAAAAAAAAVAAEAAAGDVDRTEQQQEQEQEQEQQQEGSSFLSGAERHWEGDCFVFDSRVAVNTKLEETDAKMCFNCREPLTLQDQASPLYVVGESCPYCADRKKKRYHTPSSSAAAATAAASTAANGTDAGDGGGGGSGGGGGDGPPACPPGKSGAGGDEQQGAWQGDAAPTEEGCDAEQPRAKKMR